MKPLFMPQLQEWVCEWCGMTYPPEGYDYYALRVVHCMGRGDFIHIVCKDCIDHLQELRK